MQTQVDRQMAPKHAARHDSEVSWHYTPQQGGIDVCSQLVQNGESRQVVSHTLTLMIANLTVPHEWFCERLTPLSLCRLPGAQQRQRETII